MLRFAYADSPHGQIHYALEGAGEPLVLLPASPRSYRSFFELIPKLADRHRLIAVDTLGFGSSARLPREGTMQQIAQGVFSVLDALAIDASHVFGIHTGHKVAAAMAAAQPSRVRRLIVCGKTHSIIPGQDKRNAAILARIQGRTFINQVESADAGLKAIDWARAFKSVSGMWWHDDLFVRGNDTELVDAVRQKVADELLSMPSAKGVYRANFDFDFEAAMMALEARTLIIELCNAYEDNLYGRQGLQLAKRMRNARAVELQVIDETGLGMNADSTALAAEIRSFLSAP